ncbi:membrane protein DedA with SNARE-associated domain/rhodanese-related sulfurtransferase [Pedobacter cryoconitis]|uniref:Membrane protein DedA with SNARE-associated domain/rhodanese-related sulfurtransferase n=1 Tax=Pedobacter cryoconitis TaxID=188932 RepID=A0A7W8ZJ75_9SPHI|nr:rhodanese-like domain-containing protein [Pedobacter cryoconitis]MBB5635007.1 membrane protein DedA with SNARE-associated domain/rhodanese-related sulfurtransferase [Pedobacter cryoconitis]MBB6271809.1 membrane protein DedA with SNARE-associated domain/rhodanese-related sulfurtransferase [Pedobacter cryoconitis]
MNTLIELVQTYGLWIIFLITLFQSIGLPLPAFAILIVTAAVTPAKAIDIISLLMTATAGSLIGDTILYFAGKRLGTSILGKLCRISLSPDSCVKSSGDIFNRYGPPALTVVKFVPGLSTLAPVVAGVYAMPIFSFIAFSLMAAVFYSTAAISLGVLFRHEIGSLIATLTEFGKLGVLALIISFGIYLLVKWLQRYRLIRQFRTDRVTVNDLFELIQERSGHIIFDARPEDQRIRNGFIPGSIPISDINLSEIANLYSEYDEIIVYCSCPNELTAAKYAEKLRRTGFKRIRPLLGGLDEWTKSGGSVSFN